MLEVNNLCFKYTDKQILNHVNFRLFNHDHAVIIGTNGVGKSTFMNIIAKNILPDSGSVTWLPNIKFSYLDQHLKVLTEQSVKDYLYEVYAPLFLKEAKMNHYYDMLRTANEHDFDKILNWANEIQEELERKNFYRHKSEIGNVINGLGLGDLDLDTPLNKLSGGQKAKVFLGKLLLSDADCILLDEPTNFLDVTHINWLAKFLVEYPKAFLVITHDYPFAKEIANVIFEFKDGKIERYSGDFDFYLREHEIRDEQHRKDYEAQQRYIKKPRNLLLKIL